MIGPGRIPAVFCACSVVMGMTDSGVSIDTPQVEFRAFSLSYSDLSYDRKPASDSGAQLTSNASP